MPVKELPIFPQYSHTESQGLIGTRRWVVTGGPQVLETFLLKVCASTWPGNDNTVPTLLQVGAFDENLKFCGGDDLTKLPHYKETLVVAQYRFMFFKDDWVTYMKKPYHPPGTTLVLQVIGGGQFLNISGGAAPKLKKGDHGERSILQDVRIVIPITEYHLTCDRLTNDQVPPGFRKREGTVNEDWFMGEKPGTLLFDTWRLDPSFVPSMKNIARHKLTVCLRCRDIPIADNPNAAPVEGKTYAGWNYDYQQYHGWCELEMLDQNGNGTPRYPRVKFADMFGHDPLVTTAAMMRATRNGSTRKICSGSGSRRK